MQPVNPTSRCGVRRIHRMRRFGAVLAGSTLLVAVATACEPPPPPDGRDLGLTIATPVSTVVHEGAALEVAGTVTNHGSVPADGITFAAGFDTGFVLDEVDLGPGAPCTSAGARLVICTIDEGLAPGASRPVVLVATAGTTSGPSNLTVATSSGGTEPVDDPHPNQVTTAIQVRPPAADPLALDIGNGTNYLGTGDLLGATAVPGHPAEGLFLAVNPYCTDKVNGDRYQSSHSGGTCDGTVNEEYRASGYEYAIDVPQTRTSPIDVMLWDARYNTDQVIAEDLGSTCTWNYPGNWVEVAANTNPRELAGPAQYQLRSGNVWSATTTVAAGSTITFEPAVRYRYKLGVEYCVRNYRMEPAVDSYRQDGAEPYTFSLYAPDDTPATGLDNPLLCTRTYQADTPFDPGTFLGSVRWSSLCQIGPEAPAGRYLLRVRNGGAATTPEADGHNQFGVVARVVADGSDPAAVLCHEGERPDCPVVSGAGEASLRVASNTTVARIGIGSVPADQEGRELRLDLYDPGEGGRSLRVLRPTGSGTWEPASFRWVSPGVAGSGGTTTQLATSTGSADLFNGRLLTLLVDLAGYQPPAGNDRWLVEYQFVAQNATDRTTWDASVVDWSAP